MNYSLINVDRQVGNKVTGNWLQDCSGTTLEKATERARGTEAVNSNKITVAVVDHVYTNGRVFDVERLDKR